MIPTHPALSAFPASIYVSVAYSQTLDSFARMRVAGEIERLT